MEKYFFFFVFFKINLPQAGKQHNLCNIGGGEELANSRGLWMPEDDESHPDEIN